MVDTGGIDVLDRMPDIRRFRVSLLSVSVVSGKLVIIAEPPIRPITFV